MAGSERNYHNVAAAGTNHIRTDDRIGRIVPALHDNVREKHLDELERRVLLENCDRVNTLEGRNDVSALAFGSDRSLRPFQPANRRVAVDAHHEHVTVAARADEHIDVPRVKEVEDPISEDDAPSLFPPPRSKRRP